MNKISTLSRVNPSRVVAAESALPENVDVERILLGAVLVDATAFEEIAGQLQSKDFSDPTHRLIFQAMERLYEVNTPITRVSLYRDLEANGHALTVGGLSGLTLLDDGMPRVHNVAHYISIVQDKARRRELILLFDDAKNRAYSAEEPIRELTAEIEEKLLTYNEPATGQDTLLKPMAIAAAYTGGPHGGVNDFLNPANRKGDALPTGYDHLDSILGGGLRPDQFIILAARPAMGKTALALNIAQNIATRRTNPKAVAVFSLEMSKESLLTRMLCAAARVDQRRFNSGRIDNDEQARLNQKLFEIGEAPLYVDDTAGTNIMDIHAKVRRLQRTSDDELGLVVVDYLQLLQGRGRFENRVQEISAISRGFKLLSKELRVPFLVLSQLSRAPETRPGDHRPMLSDLRESGSLEQDADVVAFIFREEVYRPDKEALKGVAEIILGKQRNGPTGLVKLAYDHAYTRFNNLARDLSEPDEPQRGNSFYDSSQDY